MFEGQQKDHQTWMKFEGGKLLHAPGPCLFGPPVEGHLRNVQR